MKTYQLFTTTDLKPTIFGVIDGDDIPDGAESIGQGNGETASEAYRYFRIQELIKLRYARKRPGEAITFEEIRKAALAALEKETFPAVQEWSAAACPA